MTAVVPHPLIPSFPHSLIPPFPLLATRRKSLQLLLRTSRRPPMPQFDPRTLTSLSDEELLALELDTELPIEEWMLVEKERGRREERRRREAERVRAAQNGEPTRPPATERNEESRIQEALTQLRAL